MMPNWDEKASLEEASRNIPGIEAVENANEVDMKKLAIGCLGISLTGAMAIAIVGYFLFIRELPVLDASISVPWIVKLDSTLTLDVTGTNNHTDSIVFDSVDIEDSFLDGFQILDIDPEPDDTDHIFDWRTWNFGYRVLPGESRTIRFTMKAVQEGHFSGDVDVCNPNQDFATVIADVVVRKEHNARKVADLAIESLDIAEETANAENPTPMDALMIVFQATRDGRSDTFAIDVDGINITRLTDELPAAGPRLFRSDDDGQLYVKKEDGTMSAPINSVFDCVSLSPDGTKIAFQSRDARPYSLVTMNFDGSHPETIVKSMWTYTPVFSPDGSKIAFMGSEGDFEIYVVNADGTNLQRLTYERGRDGGLTQGAWSPDGSKITFMSEREGKPRQVYVMNADGTNQTRLTTGVSPVFVTNHDGTYRASNPLLRVVKD